VCRGHSQRRFTSPDRLLASGRPARPQSWNRYTYVLNNPLRLVDPLGLSDKPAQGVSQQSQSDSNQPPPPLAIDFKKPLATGGAGAEDKALFTGRAAARYYELAADGQLQEAKNLRAKYLTVRDSGFGPFLEVKVRTPESPWDSEKKIY
jgi:uncharacterized protein RhaS with RHS repeats